jgi:hypothetical protein
MNTSEYFRIQPFDIKGYYTLGRLIQSSKIILLLFLKKIEVHMAPNRELYITSNPVILPLNPYYFEYYVD